MYIRTYPTKNNTIFKNLSGAAIVTVGDINTGQNPIAEIKDGNALSIFILGFDISPYLTKLNAYSYTCKLKLYDSGVIFEPLITNKALDLIYFTEEFSEGDGFSFLEGGAINGFSNWNMRTSLDTWPTFTGTFPALNLNTANQDLEFDVTSYIASAIATSDNPNFGIRVNNPTIPVDESISNKFVFTRHSKTIFKPYLEFIINDEIVDKRHNIIATKQSRFYLLNDLGENFTSLPTVEIQDPAGTVLNTPTVNNPSPGIYYIEYTPPLLLSKTAIQDVWFIGGDKISKNVSLVQSPNQIMTNKNDFSQLFFYPVTTYTHPLIRKGDIVKFAVISELRGKGSMIKENYEFRVVTTSAFELIPWSQVNVYNGKMFFFVDTNFFFPGLEYEVFLRLKTGDITQTSSMTFKFRLQENSASHLADLSASPYNNRDYLFYK